MVGGQDDATQMINKYRIHSRYQVPYQYVFIHNVYLQSFVLYKGSVLFVLPLVSCSAFVSYTGGSYQKRKEKVRAWASHFDQFNNKEQGKKKSGVVK